MVEAGTLFSKELRKSRWELLDAGSDLRVLLGILSRPKTDRLNAGRTIITTSIFSQVHHIMILLCLRTMKDSFQSKGQKDPSDYHLTVSPLLPPPPLWPPYCYNLTLRPLLKLFSLLEVLEDCLANFCLIQDCLNLNVSILHTYTMLSLSQSLLNPTLFNTKLLFPNILFAYLLCLLSRAGVEVPECGASISLGDEMRLIERRNQHTTIRDK